MKLRKVLYISCMQIQTYVYIKDWFSIVFENKKIEYFLLRIKLILFFKWSDLMIIITNVNS